MSSGPEGLTADNNQFWSRNSTSILGSPTSYDAFGLSLASGDFNGDGVDDLAIGVPFSDVDGVSKAGSVNVLYGVVESSVGAHDNGLSAAGNQIWHQNSPGVLGTPGIVGSSEDTDLFGISLAAGDFNGDGVDDLAIGVHLEDIESTSNAGAVNIIYGFSGIGLSPINNIVITQNEPDFVGASEADDLFGWSLAVGDLNGDGIDDLAIGALKEDISGVHDSGAVYVVHGSNSGFQFDDEYIITEGNLGGTLGLRESAEFGRNMTINDFDGDGLDDLAIRTTEVLTQSSVSVIYQKDHDLIFVDGFED